MGQSKNVHKIVGNKGGKEAQNKSTYSYSNSLDDSFEKENKAIFPKECCLAPIPCFFVTPTDPQLVMASSINLL